MKKNKKALSLLIAISITLVMSLLALYILEYMIPFSKNTKNIEQAVVAYYQADSWIENALLNDTNKNIINPKKDYSISILKDWYILPPVWQWNSEYDKNYNIIRIGEPIQLEIWKWQDKLYSNMWFKFYFKVPDLDKDNTTAETFKFTSSWIINWQLSSNSDILNSSWTYIKWTEICDSKDSCSNIDLWSRNWRKLDDSQQKISDFYDLNCKWTNSGCILKLSVINKLKLDNWINIPYLEWKITTDEKIKLRYKIIDTIWKSYWFQKNLRIKVPQQTLNEAFDFTVFQ